jgi:hypothetical protein
MAVPLAFNELRHCGAGFMLVKVFELNHSPGFIPAA